MRLTDAAAIKRDMAGEIIEQNLAAQQPDRPLSHIEQTREIGHEGYGWAEPRSDATRCGSAVEGILLNAVRKPGERRKVAWPTVFVILSKEGGYERVPEGSITCGPDGA
jgi:hypothetical protein